MENVREIILDTETTSVEGGRIIQITMLCDGVWLNSYLRHIDFKWNMDTWEFQLKHMGKPMLDWIYYYGSTTLEFQKQLADFYRKLGAFTFSDIQNNFVSVMYNAKFDQEKVKKAWEPYEMQDMSRWFPDRTICALEMARSVLKENKQRGEISGFKLEQVAKFFDISVNSPGGYHNSMFDVAVTNEVYQKLKTLKGGNG